VTHRLRGTRAVRRSRRGRTSPSTWSSSARRARCADAGAADRSGTRLLPTQRRERARLPSSVDFKVKQPLASLSQIVGTARTCRDQAAIRLDAPRLAEAHRFDGPVAGATCNGEEAAVTTRRYRAGPILYSPQIVAQAPRSCAAAPRAFGSRARALPSWQRALTAQRFRSSAATGRPSGQLFHGIENRAAEVSPSSTRRRSPRSPASLSAVGLLLLPVGPLRLGCPRPGAAPSPRAAAHTHEASPPPRRASL